MAADERSGAPSHLFVLFGATGDLARRKLLPAIYRLNASGALSGRWAILGVARSTGHDDASYREFVREALDEAGVEGDAGAWCDRCLHYQALDDDSQYPDLRERIETIEREHRLPGTRLFYQIGRAHV